MRQAVQSPQDLSTRRSQYRHPDEPYKPGTFQKIWHQMDHVVDKVVADLQEKI